MHSWNNNPFGISGFNEKERGKDAGYKNIPLVVAPGQEEAYLNDLAKMNGTEAKINLEQTRPEMEQREKVETENRQPVISPEKTYRETRRIRPTRTDGADCSVRWDWMA